MLLTQLLPGFVTAWVIYGLTSYPRPSQFERAIQALIYSFLVGALVAITEKVAVFSGKFHRLGVWDKQSEVVASAVLAITLGLLFSYFSNNDWFYGKARKFGFTKRTAYPSEWYGAFNNCKAYVVLHIDGDRRIMGFPTEWPSDAAVGHFSLVDASWLVGTEETPLPNESILIQASKVEMVEFLRN